MRDDIRKDIDRMKRAVTRMKASPEGATPKGQRFIRVMTRTIERMTKEYS